MGLFFAPLNLSETTSCGVMTLREMGWNGGWLGKQHPSLFVSMQCRYNAWILSLDNSQTNMKVILVSTANQFEIGNTENIEQYSTGNFEAVLNEQKILKNEFNCKN